MNRRVASADALQVRFWGVRGSTCASGPQYVEFGGHTPCVEIRCGERLFVIDAGTGISALGASLGMDAPAKVDILLSHLHIDHVGGLPFFKPTLLGKDRTIRTYCGNLDGESAKAAFDRLFAPPLFPIRLDQLPAHFEHHGFKAGETLTFEDGLTVGTHPLNHPGGATGYRFHHRGRSVCYISDIEHSDPWPDPGLAAFIRNADLMIYDGMFSETEYTYCQGWGHSTWQKGVELAKAAGVKALAIFHVLPGHDDIFLKAAEKDMQAVMPTAFIARERQGIALQPAGEAAADKAKTAVA
ncbi:MBL fold metallo-hydrolase [Microvirga terricola]|uniref:MBL fold metallo-hydrolase n=1 Tax=Microvirga terricola TaxID=2719797 RepID=A0ABX0VCP5_9HYPH|nr:MBL fold metallo-hydrolase [Microvirga terricola]NIX75612.1 MBL fold metallo-hydrolase [Microvirga terricola]